MFESDIALLRIGFYFFPNKPNNGSIGLKLFSRESFVALVNSKKLEAWFENYQQLSQFINFFPPPLCSSNVQCGRWVARNLRNCCNAKSARKAIINRLGCYSLNGSENRHIGNQLGRISERSQQTNKTKTFWRAFEWNLRVWQSTTHMANMSTPTKQHLMKFIFILLSALVTLLTSKTANCKPTLPFSLPPSLQISFPKFPSFQQLIEKRQSEAMKSYR